jgi:hypothetical protein
MFDNLDWGGQPDAPTQLEPPVEPERPAYPESCPYLGLPDDPRTRFSFADPAHRCHVKPKLVPIDLGHQGSLCLTPQYPACKRYVPPKKLGHPAARPAPVPVATDTNDAVTTHAVAPVATVVAVAKGPATPPTGSGKGRGVRRRTALVAALVVLALVGVMGAGSITDLMSDFTAGGALDATNAPPSAPPLPSGPAPIESPTKTATETPTETATNSPSQAPASTSAPTPKAKRITYVVVRGDSLLSIAARFGVTAKAIRAANNITDPNHIVVGQELVIPRQR